MSETNVLLCSAGRRSYLVQWFREALNITGLMGEVFLADIDPYCPGQAFADHFELAPSILDPSYDQWLMATLHDQRIAIAISVNDFELSHWASMPTEDNRLASLVRLTAEIQEIAEDKLQTAQQLEEHGILVPMTLLGGDIASRGLHNAHKNQRYVIKGRYGSGSRGLQVSDGVSLQSVLPRSFVEVTRADGTQTSIVEELLELVVVQPHVSGVEYGLDVVSDLNMQYAGVLARRKLAMRHGETDRAVSVDSSPFTEIARKLAVALPHKGAMDVDVIVDDEGNPWVIDVNPRFGGGYPFSHLAGANVPASYVAWANGMRADPEWLRTDPGVLSAKGVDVIRVGQFE